MKINVKINSKLVTLMLVIMLYFKPLAINSMAKFSVLNTIWDIGRVFVSIIVFWRVIIKKHKISKEIFTIIILEMLFCFSTLMNNGDMRGVIVQAISVISFSLLVYYYIEIDAEIFFRSMYYTLVVLILIHTICYLFYPNGFGYDGVYYNSIHFLASKNGLIKFLFPAIFSGLVLGEISPNLKGNKNVLFIIGLSIWLCISLESTTSLIGITVVLILCFIANLNKKYDKFEFQKLFLFIFIICLIITIIGISGEFIKLVGLFFNTSKISNYADRVKIWEKSIEIIKQHPIIGNGMAKGGHIMVNGKPMYAHNGYLEILLYGGGLGFVLLIISLKNILLVKHKIKTRASIYISCCIIGYFVMMLTESHIDTISFWGFIVMYERILHIEKIDKEIE